MAEFQFKLQDSIKNLKQFTTSKWGHPSHWVIDFKDLNGSDNLNGLKNLHKHDKLLLILLFMYVLNSYLRNCRCSHRSGHWLSVWCVTNRIHILFSSSPLHTGNISRNFDTVSGEYWDFGMMIYFFQSFKLRFSTNSDNAEVAWRVRSMFG